MSNQYLAKGTPKKVVCKSREEWLGLRTGIGASEVGTLLGVNKWETPYQLWRRKKGIDGPKEVNNIMLVGTLLEDAVSRYFEIETSKKIIKSSAGDIIYIHPEKEYLRVTPDRLFWINSDGKKNESNKGILECKTSQMDIDKENIPPQYFCQVQYQLGIMQKEHASLAWLSRGRDFGYTWIDFDADFFKYMVEVVDKFWEDCIIGDKVPECTSSEDVLLKYEKSISGKTVEAGDNIIQTYNQLKEVREKRIKLETQEDELIEGLKVFCSDAEAITYLGNILATWKTGKESTKFDKAAFEKDHPEIYAKYLKTINGSRRFSLK